MFNEEEEQQPSVAADETVETEKESEAPAAEAPVVEPPPADEPVVEPSTAAEAPAAEAPAPAPVEAEPTVSAERIRTRKIVHDC